MAEKQGSEALTVGGFGRGALLARFALLSMERQMMDHETAAYFAYNSTTAADQDEADALKQYGSMPQRPLAVKLTVGASDVEGLSEKDHPEDSEFHETFYSNETATTSLKVPRAGQWLFEKLS